MSGVSPAVQQNGMAIYTGALGEGVGPAERGDEVAGAHGEGAPLDRDPALGLRFSSGIQ